MGLCVKEKGITIYGGFGLWGCVRASEGYQGQRCCYFQQKNGGQVFILDRIVEMSYKALKDVRKSNEIGI